MVRHEYIFFKRGAGELLRHLLQLILDDYPCFCVYAFESGRFEARRGRVVEDADPYGVWETGRVPRDFPGAGHNAGNSENAARMGGVFTRFSRAATKSAFRRGQGIVRAKLSVCR